MTEDHKGFAHLHTEHNLSVLDFLRRLGVKGEFDREDLAQIAWFTAARSFLTYDRRQEFRTWLFGIVRNVFREHCRKNKRHPLDFFPDPDVYPSAGFFELQVDMRGGLKALPESPREAYILHEFFGHDHKGVAALMGTSERTAEREMADAKQRLSEYGNKHFQAVALFFGLSVDEAGKRLHAFWGPQGVTPVVPRWTWKSIVGVSGTAVGAVAVVALLWGSPVRPPTPVTVVAEAPSALSVDEPVNPGAPMVTAAVSSVPTVAISKPIVRRAPPPPPGPSLDDSRVLLLRVRKALNQGRFALAQQLLDEHQARFGTFDAPARNGLSAKAQR